MNYKVLQKSVKEICDENGMFLSDNLKDDSYMATVMDSEESKNNALNILANSNGIETSVISTDGNEIEKFTKTGDFNDDEGLEFIIDSIDSFSIMSGIEPDDTDQNGNPILNEDESKESKFSGIVDGLNTIILDQKRTADNLRDLSELSDDPEVIAIIMDLANNSYASVLDMEAAIDSYNEIMEIPDIEDDESEIDESIDMKIEESRHRVKIAESLISARSLNKLGIISDDNLEMLEESLRQIFD